MRSLYFRLVHKDLYFYKNKLDKTHKGMHNLNGLFLQKEKTVEYEGVNYYSFSVVYPSKTRLYFCGVKVDIFMYPLFLCDGGVTYRKG